MTELCRNCPDHEACLTDYPCDTVKKANAQWIEVGDWVEPHSRDLDPREVAKIEEDKLWLWLLTDKPAGPFPIDNYIITRKRAGSCRVCLHPSHAAGLCEHDSHPACNCNGEE